MSSFSEATRCVFWVYQSIMAAFVAIRRPTTLFDVVSLVEELLLSCPEIVLPCMHSIANNINFSFFVFRIFTYYFYTILFQLQLLHHIIT